MLNEVPELGPVVAWKHRQPSYVEQIGVDPMLKNRGAEQGDTFGPAETGVTLATLGPKTRQEIHAKQVAGELDWVACEAEDVTAAAALDQYRAVTE
eukprot:2835733-Karenia_brevis.AAC.1